MTGTTARRDLDAMIRRHAAAQRPLLIEELMGWIERHTATDQLDNRWDNLFRMNRLRSAEWHKDTEAWTANDWFTAFVGEVGELGNILKKIRRITSGARGRKGEQDMSVLLAKAAHEAADCILYFDLLMENLGIDLHAATTAKFNHTSQEYGFTDFMLEDEAYMEEVDNEEPTTYVSTTAGAPNDAHAHTYDPLAPRTHLAGTPRHTHRIIDGVIAHNGDHSHGMS